MGGAVYSLRQAGPRLQSSALHYDSPVNLEVFMRSMRRLVVRICAAAAMLLMASPAVALFGVYPRFHCWEYDAALNKYYAWFGYFNAGAEVIIPEGTDNFFSEPPNIRPGNLDFLPGGHPMAFRTNFDPNIGLVWLLNNIQAAAT